jgi:hypothetical protein
MICGTEWFAKPGCGVPADGQKPVSQARLAQMPDFVEALTNRDGYRHCLCLTG